MEPIIETELRKIESVIIEPIIYEEPLLEEKQEQLEIVEEV
jgi:hypothetical protein